MSTRSPQTAEELAAFVEGYRRALTELAFYAGFVTACVEEDLELDYAAIVALATLFVPPEIRDLCEKLQSLSVSSPTKQQKWIMTSQNVSPPESRNAA